MPQSLVSVSYLVAGVLFILSLSGLSAQATARRRDEIPAAERIVEEETDLFWAWYGGLGVVPTIKELRTRLDQLRAAELERALRLLGALSPEDRARVE